MSRAAQPLLKELEPVWLRKFVSGTHNHTSEISISRITTKNYATSRTSQRLTRTYKIIFWKIFKSITAQRIVLLKFCVLRSLHTSLQTKSIEESGEITKHRKRFQMTVLVSRIDVDTAETDRPKFEDTVVWSFKMYPSGDVHMSFSFIWRFEVRSPLASSVRPLHTHPELYP